MADREREIVDAAMIIADVDGLEGVSMRSVARRMHVTAMALYVHIRDKDALLDGLVDRLLSEVKMPENSLPWDQRLTTLAKNVREVLVAHPWGVSLLFSRPVVTPTAALVVESIYVALLEAGVKESQIPRVERLLSTSIIGLAASEVEGRFSRSAPANRKLEISRGLDFPGHLRLSKYLRSARDIDGEFRADLVDLVALVKSLASQSIPPT